ncbi:MAG: hypothetical protein SA339_05080 [Methanomassiliicoccus sp.]|nr:hypothetical protein [Methanomassiliicoccus sp.]
MLTIDEGKPLIIPKNELDERLANSLFQRYGKIISIEFPSIATRGCYILRSTNYIGNLSIGRDLIVRMAPKVPIHDIFRMLEYAYGLQPLDGRVKVDRLDELYEHLALLLARMVRDRVRKGLYQGYVVKEDALPYFRGRLSIPITIRNEMRGAPWIGSEYEDICTDIEDNRILAWTLYILPRLYIERPDVIHEVRMAYHALAGSVTVRPIGAQVLIGRSYSHLNEDYRLMHSICKFFLDNCGPTMALGPNEFVPFLVNMPLLFQNYVAEWLKANMPKGWVVHEQCPFRVPLYGTFHMDMVITDITKGPLLVLDTKYKDGEKPQAADIHQMVSYSHMAGVKKTVLVYPSDVKFSRLNVNGIGIDGLSFDINKEPDVAGQEFLSKIHILMGH